MFRIRRIFDNILPTNKAAIGQVQAILEAALSGVSREEIAKFPDKLINPMKYRFRTILFVADDFKGRVKGFALVSHEPELRFCFLDFISTSMKRTGHGIGGAIYERVRQETLALKAMGLFFECLPDDPNLCRNPQTMKANASRLKFYEWFGARPVCGTSYETPMPPNDDNPPFLVYDDLGQNIPLPRVLARKIVRAILEIKYGALCSPEYIDMVVDSFKDDPVRLRDFKYKGAQTPQPVSSVLIPADQRIPLVINDRHKIHHVRERGYVESPTRVKTILKEIMPTGRFEVIPVRNFSERYIKTVHDRQFVEYLKKICSMIEPGRSIYPYVFPIRNAARPPKELPVRAGYYCIDTFTPLNSNVFAAAKRAVDCALTAVVRLLSGHRLVYALIRPPGHHAERRAFGGFCYFNSNAIAAQYLSSYGKVAILDLDYHHGNGQQDIFYRRSDVLTLSIHGHPRFAYPYFSGFEDETGEDEGKGFNVNFPLPESVDGSRYREVLGKALKLIRKFKPNFLIVALGLDTSKGDPTGTWDLNGKDFFENGRLIAELDLPILVVQEGGYNHRNLGVNARRFFSGLWGPR